MNILTQIYQILSEALRNWFFFRHQKQRVTILGSARFPEANWHFQKAYQLSQQLAQRGYVILTGGGYGVMEAASRGAHDGGGVAIGCYVKHLESINAYLNQTLTFYSLMSRQSTLIQYSDALIIFPGGFGTLAELLEALVLIQNKQKRMPLFLVGSSFWEPLMNYFRETLLRDHQTIDAWDIESIVITDSIEDVLAGLWSPRVSEQ